jgi:hypothetical protein
MINGSAVGLNQINLTTVTLTNLTLNTDGSTIDVASNTPTGTYTLTYKFVK